MDIPIIVAFGVGVKIPEKGRFSFGFSFPSFKFGGSGGILIIVRKKKVTLNKKKSEIPPHPPRSRTTVEKTIVMGVKYRLDSSDALGRKENLK